MKGTFWVLFFFFFPSSKFVMVLWIQNSHQVCSFQVWVVCVFTFLLLNILLLFFWQYKLVLIVAVLKCMSCSDQTVVWNKTLLRKCDFDRLQKLKFRACSKGFVEFMTVRPSQSGYTVLTSHLRYGTWPAQCTKTLVMVNHSYWTCVKWTSQMWPL